MKNSKPLDDRQGRVPYEYILNIFKNSDPKKMAELTGTKYDEDIESFSLKLMGKNYTIKYPSADTFNDCDELVDSYTIKTILLRYLVNAKGIPPTGKNITYKEIPTGHVYYSNFYNRTILKLARLYGNNLKELEEIFINMNAEKINTGDVGYRFEFLNNVYITFIVWGEDEELSSSANILFDFNIQYYFDAEDLAVIGDIAIEFIKNKGNLPKWVGLYQKEVENGYEIN